MQEKIYLYTRFERFWHWTQALLIIVLITTGLEVHGTFEWLGFGKAVSLHNIMAWALLGLTAFAIFWHFTTGEWKQYTPTMVKIGDVVNYYLRGIFQGEKHPVKKKPQRKLNPLQRITYLFLKIVLFPLQVITGMAYLYYNHLPGEGLPLAPVALVHTAGAFA
ncbi:MAG: cytochrome b/b6 domain-containing protein, partial [Desulfobia sp.]